MRYISCDIETLGINPKNCDIIEFVAILDDLSNPLPIEKLPVFHRYLQKDVYSGESEAISMHGEAFRRIASKDPKFQYTCIGTLMMEFTGFLESLDYPKKDGFFDINAAGKNFASFDLDFLKEKITGIQWSLIKIKHRVLDVGSLYFRLGDECLPDTGICLERAGLPQTVNHNAIDDAITVIKLIRKFYLK